MKNSGANKIILAILGIVVFFFMFGGMSGLALLVSGISYIVFFFIGIGLVSMLVNKVQADEEPTTLDELTPEQKEILRKHHEEENK